MQEKKVSQAMWAGKVLYMNADFRYSANAFWDSLAASNKALAKAFLHLTELHKLDPSVYTAAVGDLSSLQSSQWEALPGNAVTGAFIAAHNWTEVCLCFIINSV